jgi:hypothetical protein
VILRDGLLLDQTNGDLASKMSGYHCFATLICCGPRAAALANAILMAFDGITIGASCAIDATARSAYSYDTKTLIWSASAVLGGDGENVGCVLRASSEKTRVMRDFLSRFLSSELIDGGEIRWDM